MRDLLTPQIAIYAICLAASAMCFFNYRKLNKAFIWLGVFLLFAAVSQILAAILISIIGNNIAFYNWVTIIYTLLIFLIFIHVKKNGRTIIWLRVIFGIGFILTTAFVLYGLSENVFSVQGLSAMSVTVALGALVVLFGMLRNPLNSSPLKMGWLWLLMGFLFYYTSTFSYWTAYYFLGDAIEQRALQNVNIVLVIIFYLILLTAIIVQLKYGDVNHNPKPRKSIKSASLLQ